jgi:choline dehydrogenase-like flavoprotein
MDNEFDVVVVGGGPVGLWLAGELALAKVKVVVLERRTERVAQSRALAIHGRTLEVFALRGFADRFLERGGRMPTGHFGALDTPLDYSVFDTRFPFIQLLPQATTEKLLEQRVGWKLASVVRGRRQSSCSTPMKASAGRSKRRFGVIRSHRSRCSAPPVLRRSRYGARLTTFSACPRSAVETDGS